MAGPTCLDVHPIYGAIYKNGEFVQRGAVLGLSVDSKEVVIAPVSGWVRLISLAESRQAAQPLPGLRVEIWQQPVGDFAGVETPAGAPN